MELEAENWGTEGTSHDFYDKKMFIKKYYFFLIEKLFAKKNPIFLLNVFIFTTAFWDFLCKPTGGRFTKEIPKRCVKSL